MKCKGSDLLIKISAIGLSIIVSIAIISCKKDEHKTAVAVFKVGTVMYQEEGSEYKRPLELNRVLKKNEIIITGNGAEVTIQIGETAVITLVQNSSVRLETILESGKTALFLNSGILINKVNKLEKDDGYMVKTRTALAAVRGTEFLVIAEKGQSKVGVNSGKVLVTRIENNMQKPVEAGEKAVVGADFHIEPLNELDKLYFDKLSLMPNMDATALTAKEKTEAAYMGVREKSHEIDLKIQELSPMPLKEIRKKYNRIDIVTLYSGKVIEGVIISRGKMFSILTPRGLETVAKKDVKHVNIKK